MRGRTIHSVRPSSSFTEATRALLRLAAQEQIGGHDALAGGVVQRQRQTQPLRPVAHGRLFIGRRLGARQER